MTDVLKNDNITSVVSAIETLVRDSSDKLTETATKYGPLVLDTAESYVRVIALIDMIKGLVAIIFAATLIVIAFKYVIKWLSSEDPYDYFVGIFISSVIILIGIFIFCNVFFDTFTTDNILSIVSPKLELIKMSKDALTQNLVGK